MFTLRTLALPLLVVATLGLSACGDGDTEGANTEVQQTSPAVQAAQDEAATFENNIAAERAELEKITADMQSGKLSTSAGKKKIKAITKKLKAKSADLSSQVEEAAAESGEQVTELDLGGDAETAPSKTK